MKVILLDNFDSFTYNIAHYLEALDVDVTVIDHLAISIPSLSQFDYLVISPGPGLPKDAGKVMEVLQEAEKLQLPVLGVCLGMQAIAEHFGGTIFNKQIVSHGQQVELIHQVDSVLFSGLPTSFPVGLYHSWAVSDIPNAHFRPTAYSSEGIMMALEGYELPFYGVQFHPESVLSEHGKEVLLNFLKVKRKGR